MIHIWAVIAIGAGFSTVSIIEGPLKVFPRLAQVWRMDCTKGWPYTAMGLLFFLAKKLFFLHI